MEKAIVTGATGFIGSFLVNKLLKENVEVLSIGRKHISQIDNNRLNLIKGSEYLQLNMDEIDSLADSIKKIKWEVGESCVFYHLAWGGQSNLSDLDEKSQYENITWSVNAFELAKRIRCKKFIHVGTMEEAFTKEYLKLDYKDSNKYNRHVIYSLSKIYSKEFLKLRASNEIDIIFTRNSHIMGPFDDKDSFLQVTLEKLIRNEDLIFSSGEQIFDVISVTDCANAYYLIGQYGLANKDYWIGSGQPRPLKDYVNIMYKLYPSNKEMKFGKMPYNDISLKIEDFSVDLLKKDTGFSCNLSYEDTVKDLYKWLINHEI